MYLVSVTYLPFSIDFNSPRKGNTALVTKVVANAEHETVPSEVIKLINVNSVPFVINYL
jgi:hypothetical protein